MTTGPLDRHPIVVDLGFGDAGKGSIVDWLCARPVGRAPVAVVRFNGGAQAAHHVVGPGGRVHAFAQFGAGTFTPGVRTHLSRFVLVEPLALAAEAAALAALGVTDALDRLAVDRRALLTTPYHRAANRARERARGDGRHGSCGMGIGETVAFSLTHPDLAPAVGDIADRVGLRRKLVAVRDALQDELGSLDAPPVDAVVEAYEAFAARVAVVDDGELGRLLAAGPVVFEGAQGVLLDEWRGFHPYTTWSTTTFDNADTLLAEAGRAGEGFRLGVVRTYTTRHGAGPFPTEDQALAARLPEPHNGHGQWQGAFRVGHFDAVAHRYAVEVAGGVHALAVTHLDRPGALVCEAYRAGGRRVGRIQPGPFADLDYQEGLTRWLDRVRPIYRSAGPDWVTEAAGLLKAPVWVGSWGPTAGDKMVVRPTAVAA